MSNITEKMGSPRRSGRFHCSRACFCCSLAAWPLAHNVTVFAWVEGDTVHVESKFSGGRRPVAAPVEVYDTRGNLLLKGVTDEKGEFSFKVPKKTEMKVVLLAGMGHKGEWTIPLSDLENTSASAPPQATETGSPSTRVDRPG